MFNAGFLMIFAVV